MENDVENLVWQGLAKVTTIPNIDYNPTEVPVAPGSWASETYFRGEVSTY
jgi:hypothetical protein